MHVRPFQIAKQYAGPWSSSTPSHPNLPGCVTWSLHQGLGQDEPCKADEACDELFQFTPFAGVQFQIMARDGTIPFLRKGAGM